MPTVIRFLVGAVVVLHGLVHLLGVVQGFGWAEVPQLQAPISTAMGAAWLAAGVLVLAAATALMVRLRWAWAVCTAAAGVSQLVIMTAWSDARTGTLANVLLVLVALATYVADGRTRTP